MARSLDLQTILRHPEELRNDEWERAFFEALIESNVSLRSEKPEAGPDGWPYMLVETDVNASEPAIRLIDWLSTRGIGLVVNPQKDVPDYVFTYGMLWNFKERGQFITEVKKKRKSGVVHLEADTKVLAGPPTREYLPDYVREVLREFFAQQEISEPRILVMSSEDDETFDLCFSLESLGNPPQAEHHGIAEALAWFLPGHYSIMLVSEKNLPKFHALE